MSEPYSLVIACQISAEDLQRYMGAPVLPVDGFNDWPDLDVGFEPLDFDRADAIAKSPPFAYFKTQRQQALKAYGWRFHHDPATSQLNVVSLLWAESWSDMLGGINILRQLAPFCPGGGYVLCHGFAFHEGHTQFAITFDGGRSIILRPDDAGSLIDHAAPIARYVDDKSRAADILDPRPDPATICRDQLAAFGPT